MLSEAVKMAAGALQRRRITAAVAVFLALLNVLKLASCDEQVPLLLWTSGRYVAVRFY